MQATISVANVEVVKKSQSSEAMDTSLSSGTIVVLLLKLITTTEIVFVRRKLFQKAPLTKLQLMIRPKRSF